MRTFTICFLAISSCVWGADAVTVFIDPATGKTRQPTAADIEKLIGVTKARLAEKQTESPTPLDVRYGPGGAVGVKLGPSSLSYIVATRTPDGKVSTECVTGAKGAK